MHLEARPGPNFRFFCTVKNFLRSWALCLAAMTSVASTSLYLGVSVRGGRGFRAFREAAPVEEKHGKGKEVERPPLKTVVSFTALDEKAVQVWPAGSAS
jgi:hypothetical protein